MMDDGAVIGTIWEKSPESAETGECVEVSVCSAAAWLRTSRRPAAGRLEIGAEAWARLTARIGAFRTP